MALIPTNEKLLMVEGDDEAWVDTHHGMGESHDLLERSHDLSVDHMIYDQYLHNVQLWSRQQINWSR